MLVVKVVLCILVIPAPPLFFGNRNGSKLGFLWCVRALVALVRIILSQLSRSASHHDTVSYEYVCDGITYILSPFVGFFFGLSWFSLLYAVY